jgi:methionyl-tRNA formyltransferase
MENSKIIKMQNSNSKIIFMGTPEFGAIILKKLAEREFKPVLVLTETDKPVGRKKIVTPPPVKVLADNLGIKVIQPEKIMDSARELKKINPDLVIVAAYGRIIPKEIIEIPKHGCLNVHPSLLPRYRGSSPIQSAILNGDAQTGVTIMLLDEKLDHGAVVSQVKTAIGPEENYEKLHNELADLGSDLLAKTIPAWLSGEIKPVPQNESEATYTKELDREDGKIHWEKTAEEIERQIKAFSIWPNSYTECGDNVFDIKRMKIWKAKVQKQLVGCPIGSVGKTFMATNEQIAVQTGKNFLIIEELQIEGGKRMETKEFLRGRSDFIGTILK